MLQTQYYGNGFGGFGALTSSAATADLQRYLVSIGKLGSSNVTGVMNDATMGVIYNLLVASASTVSKIPLLPSDVRSGISSVVSALQSADSKIKSVSFGMATLSSVLSNWATINAAVRAVSSSAANSLAAAREAVYNAVGGYASYILRAVKIFFPPTTPTSTAIQPAIPVLTSSLTSLLKTNSAVTATATSSAASQSYPAGTIYAFSQKLGRYRIAIPNPGGVAGLGVQTAVGNCIFGDCGFGAAYTEVAPSTTAPANGVPTTETELEKRAGALPLYKKWQFWTAIGGGVAIVGTGAALLIRRKRSA
jgi:hypothetical protein